ncbi:hypothetical protein QVA66_03895 [Staphylococcus chromogenes]|nr:hypothetical protein [Staphylococcus chromogenes]
MGWRGADYDGEFPSLGWQVADWIESYCVIPDGDHKGEPYLLTDEMVRFLVNHYRIHEEASQDRPHRAWHYRRSQLVRPQKWGKGPLTAAMICAESVGPVLFAGWDAAGEPVGRPWATPLIQVTAASEDQTANVYAALQPMIEEGPLAELIPDTGDTRINLPGGGRIDPVTSKARSRLGQRVTFVVQDETQNWTKSNGGLLLATTQRRGLAGMGGRAVETTNAWDPSENSVAQQTFESQATDIYRDFKRAPATLSYKNKRDRAKIHKHVYGDSWWVDLAVIEAEAAELIEADPAEAERFFGNRIVYGSGQWIREDTWDTHSTTETVADGEAICLGFDGSENNDWTAIVAETMDGRPFIPTYGPDRRATVWNPAEWGGFIPRGEVHAAVSELFERYEVKRMYCDPQDWRSEIGDWALEHGSEHVFEWPTNKIPRMFEALKRFEIDLQNDRVRPLVDKVLKTAVLNARKVAKPAQRYLLGKATEQQKIDPAMAMVLAHEAAMDSHAVGWQKKTDTKVLVFGRRR